MEVTPLVVSILVVRRFLLIILVVIGHFHDDGLKVCCFDNCSCVHEVGCWMEDSIPLDPCSMLPIDLGLLQ